MLFQHVINIELSIEYFTFFFCTVFYTYSFQVQQITFQGLDSHLCLTGSSYVPGSASLRPISTTKFQLFRAYRYQDENLKELIQIDIFFPLVMTTVTKTKPF